MPRPSYKQERSYLPATAFLCLLITAVAAASTLSVSPVRVVIAPGRDTTSLTLSNGGRRSETFQIRAFLWTQAGNGSHLIPTSGVEFSPPMGTLRAGASQIVRLMVPRPAGPKEGSYRLFIDQLPPATITGRVTMVLRLSIPVFVEPRARVAAAVRWHLHRHQGHLWLTAVNTGGRHMVIHDLRLHGADCGNEPVRGGAFSYLLADSKRRWRIACPDAATRLDQPLHLSMRTSHGTVTIPLAASAPDR